MRRMAASSKTAGARNRFDSQTDSQEGEQPWTLADNSGVKEGKMKGETPALMDAGGRWRTLEGGIPTVS